MQKMSEYSWNNNIEWLNRWYKISVCGRVYCAHDFTESNGRIFFKVRLSSLLGSGKKGLKDLDDEYIDDRLRDAKDDDWAIGFVKPLSSKATIIEVLPADRYDGLFPSLALCQKGVSWIESYKDSDGTFVITEACASSRYEDGYEITRREIKSDIAFTSKKIPAIILPADSEGMTDYVIFTGLNGECSTAAIFSVDREGRSSCIIEADAIYGYNEKVVYLDVGGRMILLDRKSGKTDNLSSIIINKIAYIDAARDEVFCYEKEEFDHPGMCALIGMVIGRTDDGYKVSKERVECPEVSADALDPVIFDGERYVWRINRLFSGYKVFRKDGSLREKFLVDEEDETSKSPVVFTTHSCVFTEWGTKAGPHDIRLSYTTNKGLCRMFAATGDNGCLTAIKPEDEDRI